MNKIPFPQANDLNKVLIFLKNYNYNTPKELKIKMNLTQNRQLDYYKSACVFLGFIENNKNFDLTKSGKKIVSTRESLQKEIFILELIKTPMLKKIVFNESEKTTDMVLEEFSSYRKLSKSTKKRRVSTIKSWIRWLNNNI